MKNYLFIFLATVLFCISCTQEMVDVSDSTDITEADLFLVSNDFKQYERIVKEDGRILKNALKALTQEEKERYFSLMNSASLDMTEEEYVNIVSEIKELTGIDTDARLHKLHDARMNLISKINFSKVELLKAMQRHCLNMRAIPRSRSTNEADTEECLYDCSLIYNRVYSSCDPTDGYGPGHNPKDDIDTKRELWEGTKYCEMIASAAFDQCAIYC
ncbi:MAG: hypothetical protein NC339_03550 [Muribaculaceae bacterium]|nr:hypothetical protein [Muribaculaceae bacterium]